MARETRTRAWCEVERGVVAVVMAGSQCEEELSKLQLLFQIADFQVFEALVGKLRPPKDLLGVLKLDGAAAAAAASGAVSIFDTAGWTVYSP